MSKRRRQPRRGRLSTQQHLAAGISRMLRSHTWQSRARSSGRCVAISAPRTRRAPRSTMSARRCRSTQTVGRCRSRKAFLGWLDCDKANAGFVWTAFGIPAQTTTRITRRATWSRRHHRFQSRRRGRKTCSSSFLTTTAPCTKCMAGTSPTYQTPTAWQKSHWSSIGHLSSRLCVAPHGRA